MLIKDIKTHQCCFTHLEIGFYSTHCAHVTESVFNKRFTSFDLIPPHGLQQWTQIQSHFLTELVIPYYELFDAILGTVLSLFRPDTAV